jgi:Uma2 family endonuclease
VLAVEIAGEDEEERVLRDKARWYLDSGVATVWLVFPEIREVLVLRSNGESRLRKGDSLEADAALPGLAPKVADLFLQLDR